MQTYDVTIGDLGFVPPKNDQRHPTAGQETLQDLFHIVGQEHGSLGQKAWFWDVLGTTEPSAK